MKSLQILFMVDMSMSAFNGMIASPFVSTAAVFFLRGVRVITTRGLVSREPFITRHLLHRLDLISSITAAMCKHKQHACPVERQLLQHGICFLYEFSFYILLGIASCGWIPRPHLKR
jgi:hypothetical protein